MSVPEPPPESPGLGWRAFLHLLERLPQAGLSRAVGRIADVPIPRPLRRPVLGALGRALGIDASEAEMPLDAYPSANAYFVRRLRPGVRRWPTDEGVLASPVDGIVGRAGQVDRGRLIQAKGRTYSAADLLDSVDEAARFEGGSFVTLYLSPRHYHRIHTPQAGCVARARHVPGSLLPVNAPAVRHLPDLFPRNERLICFVDGPLGRTAVVAIGAYNVGRISASFDAAWGGGPAGTVTNGRVRPPPVRTYDPPVGVARGEEIMAFHLGSSVVLLAEAGRVGLDPRWTPGSEVRVGDPLARRPL